MSAQDQAQSKSPPWEQGGTQATAEFGAWLRQQREVRQVDIDEVAQATKVGRRYLDAFEEGRFELLPAPVFAKGFLREYARYVGLDADEVVNSYLTALRATEEDREPRGRRPGRRSSRRRPLALATTLLLVLVAFGAVGWWLHQSLRSQPAAKELRSRPVVPVVPVAPQPRPGRRTASSLPESGPLALTLDFRRRCWVEMEIDGQPALSEEHLQGESLTVHAQDRIRLSLDHPEAVEVMVNGRPYGLQAGPDGQVRDAVITLEGTEGEASPKP